MPSLQAHRLLCDNAARQWTYTPFLVTPPMYPGNCGTGQRSKSARCGTYFDVWLRESTQGLLAEAADSEVHFAPRPRGVVDLQSDEQGW